MSFSASCHWAFWQPVKLFICFENYKICNLLKVVRAFSIGIHFVQLLDFCTTFSTTLLVQLLEVNFVIFDFVYKLVHSLLVWINLRALCTVCRGRGICFMVHLLHLAPGRSRIEKILSYGTITTQNRYPCKKSDRSGNIFSDRCQLNKRLYSIMETLIISW